MKWQNPLNPDTVTGKQTLTEYGPVTKILRAGKEIQDLVVVGASININGTPLTCRVRENILEVAGEIEAGSKGAGEVTIITGVTPVLEVSGSTLKITLQFTAQKMNLANMMLTEVSVPDASDSISGTECS